MGWHHGDYLNLISSLGGLGSAFFAAYATYQAKKATETSILSLNRSERQNEVSRLMEELVRLAERSNSCLASDNHLTKDHGALIEITVACFYAKQAIEKSNLSFDDKKLLKKFFIRHLRPGVNGEFKNGYVMLDLGMNSRGIELRKLYREVQGYLDLDGPVEIPEPKSI